MSLDAGLIVPCLEAASIRRRRAKIVKLDEDQDGNTSSAVLRFEFDFVEGDERTPGLMMVRVPLLGAKEMPPRRLRRMLIETAWAEVESYLFGDGEGNIFDSIAGEERRPSNAEEYGVPQGSRNEVEDSGPEDGSFSGSSSLDSQSESELQAELRRIEADFEEAVGYQAFGSRATRM